MTYEELRPQISTGDPILWQGDKPLQKAIMWFTSHSHSSTVVRLSKYNGLKDRVFLVEALRGGLEFRLLSQRIKESGGKVFLYKVKENIDRLKVLNFCIHEVSRGIPYDYKSFCKLIFATVSMDFRKYLCSEFSFAAIMAGADNKLKAELIKRSKGNVPKPGDIIKWVKGELIEITR